MVHITVFFGKSVNQAKKLLLEFLNLKNLILFPLIGLIQVSRN